MDDCPTHGERCPGHFHAEVAGGKVFVSRPGRVHPIDLDEVRWTATIGRGAPPRAVPLVPWPDDGLPFPFYVQEWQAAILDRMMRILKDPPE